jgi:ABC-type lipoprotein export system ATPase subunit
MNIELQTILPIPLKDRFLHRKSSVWNTVLQLEKGAYIKIKAPSGSGKTTLIHILYHIRFDYQGLLLIDEKNIQTYQEEELAALRQNRLSIIFQDLRLFPNLTARENIELNRVLQNPFYSASVIDEMAAELGIGHILDQDAGLCSYGEQQRIAIIRSLMQPFECLLMDEPFSHLDQENTRKAAALIDAECKKRKAGLIITDLDDDAHFQYDHQYQL